MKQDQIKYEEWLTTIANTRLLFNTMAELEAFLDAPSIHSNGIKRCFATPQRLRAAFRDLKVEANLMTDGYNCLEKTMEQYQQAWRFFRDNLSRRSNPEQTALELLAYCCPPYVRENIGPKKLAIFEEIIRQDISIPFLFLMLIKVIPGYDSKEGDIANFSGLYEKAMSLLERFTGRDSCYETIPCITLAREEKNKTRLMLLYHVSTILTNYEARIGALNMYDMAYTMKQEAINLDIVGFWNESGGKLEYTDFWQIEDATNYGSYFLTHWHKDADNVLSGIRYTLHLFEGDNGTIMYYILHPTSIKHIMKGIPLGDQDQTWYETPMLSDAPSELMLHRKMFSSVWPQQIPLTRCTDTAVVAQYEQWLNHDCTIQKPFRHLEYRFDCNLYATTPTHLYIPTTIEGEYYKIPRSSHEGFDRVQLGDNVGTMQMNGQTYLVFDEFLLFIRICKEELQRYQIERVSCIE